MGDMHEPGRGADTERIGRLQEVTSALSESLTPSQVADVILHQGIAALGACAGSIVLLSSDGAALNLLAAVGYSEEALGAWHSFPITNAAPLADCVRSGEMILLASRDLRARRYPDLAPLSTQDQAWAAVPLSLDGRVMGAIGLSFAEPHDFDTAERDFMRALARQCAQALERARLYEAERHARAAAEAAQSRLAFLSEASIALSASLDYETTLHTLARVATPVLADWCLVDVVEPDGAIRRVAASHADAAKHELVQRLMRYRPEHDASLVVGALRSRRPVVAAEVPDAMLVDVARDAEHLRIVRDLAPRAFLIVPLLARDHVLGAISLVVSDSGWRYGPADVVLAEELARRAAVAIDNARLYSQARSAVRARDELLSIVSHDLQNPLTVIKAQAELLARRAARGEVSNDLLLGGLKRVEGETVKMQRLIGELLDFARLQSSQALILDRRPVDLVALARQVAAERQQSTERHTICVVAGAPELAGRWDAVRVERLLDNLLSNAIKYSPDGGEITVEIARREESGRPWATLAVRDRGVGIPPDELPRIFERFYRAGNVSGRIGGTGIGLAIARQIAEQHGGAISLESEEGRGSIFTVRLPLDET